MMNGVLWQHVVAIARHVAVEDHPDEKWAVESLEVLQNIALRHLDLNSKILLSFDHDWLGETERSLGVGITVRDRAAVF